MIEHLRSKAVRLCAENSVTVTPYAGGWWLTRQNINRVVGELAGLCSSDIRPLPVVGR